MADSRVLLAAHDGDAMTANADFEALDAVEKQRRFGKPPVEDVAFGVVEIAAVGPAAEFFAEE
jgi:hypothetical protein